MFCPFLSLTTYGIVANALESDPTHNPNVQTPSQLLPFSPAWIAAIHPRHAHPATASFRPSRRQLQRGILLQNGTRVQYQPFWLSEDVFVTCFVFQMTRPFCVFILSLFLYGGKRPRVWCAEAASDRLFSRWGTKLEFTIRREIVGREMQLD